MEEFKSWQAQELSTKAFEQAEELEAYLESIFVEVARLKATIDQLLKLVIESEAK